MTDVIALPPTDLVSASVGAVETALRECAASLEQARHAGSLADALAYLSDASAQLCWARSDLVAVGDPYMAAAAADVAGRFEQAMNGPPTGMDLATFQATILLSLQAEVGALAALPLLEWGQRRDGLMSSETWALVGVLGALFTVAGCQAYIDYKQSHGGYRRGSPGVARPLVAYRYPR